MMGCAEKFAGNPSCALRRVALHDPQRLTPALAREERL